MPRPDYDVPKIVASLRAEVALRDRAMNDTPQARIQIKLAALMGVAADALEAAASEPASTGLYGDCADIADYIDRQSGPEARALGTAMVRIEQRLGFLRATGVGG